MKRLEINPALVTHGWCVVAQPVEKEEIWTVAAEPKTTAKWKSAAWKQNSETNEREQKNCPEKKTRPDEDGLTCSGLQLIQRGDPAPPTSCIGPSTGPGPTGTRTVTRTLMPRGKRWRGPAWNRPGLTRHQLFWHYVLNRFVLGLLVTWP